MSRESFEAFMNKLQQDGGLQKELREKLGDPAQGVKAEDLNKFAAAKGYDFNVQEIKDELSDKQLDTVAGGVLPGPLPISLSPLGAGYIRFDSACFQKFGF